METLSRKPASKLLIVGKDGSGSRKRQTEHAGGEEKGLVHERQEREFGRVAVCGRTSAAEGKGVHVGFGLTQTAWDRRTRVITPPLADVRFQSNANVSEDTVFSLGGGPWRGHWSLARPWNQAQRRAKPFALFF